MSSREHDAQQSGSRQVFDVDGCLINGDNPDGQGSANDCIMIGKPMGPTGITPLHHWISFDEFKARYYWTRCNKTVWGITCRFKRDPTTLQWDPMPVQFGYLAFQMAIEKCLRITWVPPGKYVIRLARCHIKI